MRYGTKWFSSALAMAFLAVVALCVSPAFAWSCCCSAEQAVTVATASTAPVSASSTFSEISASEAEAPRQCARPCCQETGKKAPSQVKTASPQKLSAANTANTTIVKKKCACPHDDASPVVAAVPSSNSFFAASALAMPMQVFALAFEEDARFAPCFHIAARPRSPEWRSSSGRGPPIFSS